MSNYTIENLIPATAGAGRVPAIKVGGQVFTMQMSGTSATDFYLCASVIPSVNFDAAGGLDPADGLYVCQNGRMLNGYPVYRKTGTSYYLSYITNDGWIITDVDPEDDLTEHILFANNESADITDWPEPMTVTYASSGTWTGYKAIQDQVTGAWGYVSTVTSNLTYSEVTPVIGKVYADGALIEANLWSGIPTSGLVFHASLATSSATAETGQTLTEIDGSPTYATVQGIPCAEFDGYCYLRFSDTGFPYPNGFSVSLWAKGNVQDQQRCCVSWGTNEANESFGVMLNPNGTMKTTGAKDENSEWTSGQGSISTSGWNHICVVNRGTSEDIYVNGTKIGTFNWTRAVVLGSYGYLGAMTDMDWLLIGYLAGVRIYSRQLTDSEITALAAEYTPTPSA